MKTLIREPAIGSRGAILFVGQQPSVAHLGGIVQDARIPYQD